MNANAKTVTINFVQTVINATLEKGRRLGSVSINILLDYFHKYFSINHYIAARNLISGSKKILTNIYNKGYNKHTINNNILVY